MEIQAQPDYLIFAQDSKTGELLDFPNIARGWGLTIEQTQSKPPLEWMNGAFNRVDKNILYLLQQGVPEWNNAVLYPIGAVIKYKNIVYVATVQNDNAIPSTNTTKWSKLIDDASMSKKGIVQLSSATDSDSEVLASTPKAVKAANDNANGRLPSSGGTLSGKTIISYATPELDLVTNTDKSTMRIFSASASGGFAFTGTDSSVKTRIRFTRDTEVINFENVSNVTVNNTPVLKQGDYGVGNYNLSTSQITDDLGQAASFIGSSPANVPTSIKNVIGSSAGVVGITMPYRANASGTKFSARLLFDVELSAKSVFLQNYVNDAWQKPIKLITTENIADYQSGLGVGQTWQDVKDSRKLNVSYANDTGKPITVVVAMPVVYQNTSVFIYVNGIPIAYNYIQGNGAQPSSLMVIVPDGSSYKVTSGDNMNAYLWSELR